MSLYFFAVLKVHLSHSLSLYHSTFCGTRSACLSLSLSLPGSLSLLLSLSLSLTHSLSLSLSLSLGVVVYGSARVFFTHEGVGVYIMYDLVYYALE